MNTRPPFPSLRELLACSLVGLAFALAVWFTLPQ